MLIAVCPLGLRRSDSASGYPQTARLSFNVATAPAHPIITNVQPIARRNWPVAIRKPSSRTAIGTVTAVSSNNRQAVFNSASHGVRAIDAEIRIAIDEPARRVIFDRCFEVLGNSAALIICFAEPFRQATRKERAPDRYPFTQTSNLIEVSKINRWFKHAHRVRGFQIASAIFSTAGNGSRGVLFPPRFFPLRHAMAHRQTTTLPAYASQTLLVCWTARGLRTYRSTSRKVRPSIVTRRKCNPRGLCNG